MKYVEMAHAAEDEQIKQICTAIEGGLKTGLIVDNYKVERFKKKIADTCKVSYMITSVAGLTKDTTVLTFTKYAHGVQ